LSISSDWFTSDLQLQCYKNAAAQWACSSSAR
jgi:hypothetical protein